MDDAFRDAVLSAAHSALVDDDASEEERQALADDLSNTWPPDVSAMPLPAQVRLMDPDLRDALRSQGIPDDEVFVAAYALAHLLRFGEPFRPD
jgi:Anti-CRISPR protein AcrIC5